MSTVPPPSAAGLAYRAMMASWSPEQLAQLARAKRFLELWAIDADLRSEFTEIANSGGSFAALAGRLKLDIPIGEMAPIVLVEHARIRRTPELKNYPLGHLWDTYIMGMVGQRRDLFKAGQTDGANPDFDEWRLRQARRLKGELGENAEGITHPTIAFELSEGCSVGCWFCGISAERFRGHWPYATNQDMWRAVLRETMGVLGKATGTGFCYWATDPSDNPDYAEFIFDFYNATGSMPQTTTAAPLKNVALTRKVMALYDKYRTVTNRFSILNRKILQRVHDTFTPEELMGVEMVIQAHESMTVRSDAGRARGQGEKKKEVLAEASTIACVSGFLVNMPLGRVQLVTPTAATDLIPVGYYVLGERSFTTAEEYGAAIRDLAAEHFRAEMRPSDMIALRPDITISVEGDDVILRDRLLIHTLHGEWAHALVNATAANPVRLSKLIGQMSTSGLSVLAVVAEMGALFAKGLFLEQWMLATYATQVQTEVLTAEQVSEPVA